MLIAFNKPFNALCQFTTGAGRRTLADFVTVKGVYPAGRLDYDSEGLLLLTDEGSLQQRIADPRHRTKKTYLAQVERIPDGNLALTLFITPVRAGGRERVSAGRKAKTSLPSPDLPISRSPVFS